MREGLRGPRRLRAGTARGPHLALVDDGAVGLGLSAIPVGARAQGLALHAQLLPGVCARRLLILLRGLPVIQMHPLFLDGGRPRALLLLPLFSFAGWLHFHFCTEKSGL